MSAREKIIDEIKELAVVGLYFFLWIGMLVAIKKFVLAEYQIEFAGLSAALIGALVLAKVVLILEHVPPGRLVRNRPAWVEVVWRTALYAIGVVVVLLLEKGFEGRHEYGSFWKSLTSLFQRADIDHVWANAICITGALLGYNVLAVIRRYLGEGGLARIMLSPLPEEPKPERDDGSLGPSTGATP
jgi:hypothetical protein